MSIRNTALHDNARRYPAILIMDKLKERIGKPLNTLRIMLTCPPYINFLFANLKELLGFEIDEEVEEHMWNWVTTHSQ